MGGKKTTQTSDQQTTAKTELPAWMTQGGQQLYNQAKAASDANPVQAYGGQRTADLTANQQQASQIAANSAGSWKDQMQQALGMAQSAGSAPGSSVTAGQFDNAAASQYMNPYQQQVQANTLARMREQDTMDRQSLGDSAQAAKAYGGSRQGVMEALQSRDQATARQNYIDQSNADAYANAQQQFNADANRSLQGQTTNAGLNEQALNRGLAGSSLMNTLAQGAQGLTASDIAQLSGTGGVEQQTNQAGLDTAYDTFLRNQNAGMDRYSQLMSILTGTPHDTTTSGTSTGTQTTKQTGGFLQDLMGTLIAGAGAAGGLGWAPFASDRRLKVDVARVGQLPNGLPVYEFAYRWDRAKRQVGVMADEVARLLPAALGPIVAGFRTVNYAKLGEAF